VAISASILERLMAYYLANLEAANSASILDLLKASSLTAVSA
jgi:hypothetical protein